MITAQLKKDLSAIHDDWESAAASPQLRESPAFLTKFAEDIIQLCKDAEASSEKNKTAALILHLLNTPWGAPFISEKTLSESALAYIAKPEIPSPFQKIIENFAKYHAQFKSQLFDIFEDFYE